VPCSAEKLAERLQLVRDDPEVGPASSLLPLNQAGLEENLEVMADRRLAQAQRLGQMADACLPRRLRLNEAEQAKSRRIGDHPECTCEAFRVVSLDRSRQ